ncbi:hypothetical protein AAFF_G00153490 [Aldrovandia affinis]|uniref:Uncharacterized protein n=1 Tax=Aldrovandia affinis TaxID=143900 RepID=A0AAD7T1N1_9TELE|nr:hypothetical protein AAFF_G00153490 [Aldrovandia affinis]
MKALTIPLVCRLTGIPGDDVREARQHMEVELPYRYIVYGTVGFSILYLVPQIFGYLNLAFLSSRTVAQGAHINFLWMKHLVPWNREGRGGGVNGPRAGGSGRVEVAGGASDGTGCRCLLHVQTQHALAVFRKSSRPVPHSSPQGAAARDVTNRNRSDNFRGRTSQIAV